MVPVQMARGLPPSRWAMAADFILEGRSPSSRGGWRRQAEIAKISAMIDPKAIDNLYRDTVSAADRARAWFDGPGQAWRERLDAPQRALVAIEGLGVTTRLLAVMTWLLDPRHAETIPAFVNPEVAALAADHPLLATPGAAIADASRRLVMRAAALAMVPKPQKS